MDNTNSVEMVHAWEKEQVAIKGGSKTTHGCFADAPLFARMIVKLVVENYPTNQSNKERSSQTTIRNKSWSCWKLKKNSAVMLLADAD